MGLEKQQHTAFAGHFLLGNTEDIRKFICSEMWQSVERRVFLLDLRGFVYNLQVKSTEKINSKIRNLSPLFFFQLFKKRFFKSYYELWNVNP